MPDNVVEILIKFGLDKSKATEASAEISRLNETIAQASRKSGAEMEQAADKTQLFGKRTADVKKVLEDLKNEFPLVGQVMQAFSNPFAATLNVIHKFYNAVKRHIEELNAKLDEMESAAARPLSNFKEHFR